MADPTDLADTIASEAQSVASSSADGQSATARSLGELIEADKYLAAKAARSSKRRGLLFTKLVPPPAIGDAPQGSGGFAGGPV